MSDPDNVPVKVHIYDLSNGMARSLSQAFLGKEHSSAASYPPLPPLPGPVRFALFPNEKRSSRSRRKTNQNERAVTSTLAIITSTLAIKFKYFKYVIKKALKCYMNSMSYLHNVKMHVLNIF
jgi:hypothetical protein